MQIPYTTGTFLFQLSGYKNGNSWPLAKNLEFYPVLVQEIVASYISHHIRIF